MAVAFDAVGPSSAGQSALAATSSTWSHTCTGSDRVLIVSASFGDIGNGAITATATYNGVGMTSVGKQYSNNGTDGFVQMWSLVAPATGTNDVVVTPSAVQNVIASGSISFTGANQTTPVGTGVMAAGTGTPTVAVTGTTAGNMVVDAVCNGASITSSNQTQRWLRNVNTNSAAGNAAGSTAAAGGSVTMSYAVAADWYGIIAVEVLAASAVTRESVDLTHVGSSTWVAPASSAAVAPTYPSGIQAGDCIYAVLHIKPDTATVTTPTNWSLVTSASGGSGTQGAGAGATRVHLYRRIASAGHTGTESFTITGGSSPVAFMRAYRATGTNVAFETETTTSWSVTTASTTIGGTAGAGLTLAAKDQINCVIGTPDDQSSTLTLTGLTATGATLGTLTNDPSGTVINAQGNDISATAYRIAVTAGTSNTAPVATATSSSSETAMGFLFRVRATADAATSLPAAPYVIQQAALVRAHYW